MVNSDLDEDDTNSDFFPRAIVVALDAAELNNSWDMTEGARVAYLSTRR